MKSSVLIYSEVPAPSAPTDETVFGGKATLNLAEDYPVCRECGEAMTFLCQIPSVRDPYGSFIALFQCTASEGMCDTWDADSGANAAIRVSRSQLLMEAPEPEQATYRTSFEHRYAVVSEDLTEPYNDLRRGFKKKTGRSPREVLGYIGGDPVWIQGDESPHCDVDGTTMGFVGMIEEGIAPEGSRLPLINFGSGAAYVFECEHQTKYLWQE